MSYKAPVEAQDTPGERVVTTLVGRQAVLPCDHNGGAGNVSLIIWTKGSDIITQVALQNDVTFVAPWGPFATRLGLTDDINLQVENARLEDEGHYQCAVTLSPTNRQGVAEVHLYVYAQPEAPVITGRLDGDSVDPDGNMIPPGMNLTLVCSSSGGTPPANLTWYRQGKKVVDDVISYHDNSTGDDVTSVSELLVQLTEDDDMDVMTCTSWGPEPIKRQSTSITLRVGFYDPQQQTIRYVSWSLIGGGVSGALIVLLILVVIATTTGKTSDRRPRTSDNFTNLEAADRMPIGMNGHSTVQANNLEEEKEKDHVTESTNETQDPKPNAVQSVTLDGPTGEAPQEETNIPDITVSEFL
ncbi:PREDICTED: kin of IRRE-like protein 1 [Branchiostoma belcheri]|uniref:Kin of IRRE-like protein 1 n=1 Tax=Branchiostoma belcheri TaxID=7741 RepID=A0A6P4YY62_BRABE|nr:PREDICTED: kin of IRRE-like protein 1 [Branchiostoma belcheri]